jgi:hypothetical protein
MSDVAHADWRDGPRYWVLVAGLLSATAFILGIWVWADQTISRDITEVQITETSTLLFNCDKDHFFGSGIWLQLKNEKDQTAAVACYDWDKNKWYLRNPQFYSR